LQTLAILLLVLGLQVTGSPSPQTHDQHGHREMDPETPIYVPTPGHQKMLDLLRDIRDRAPVEHFWLGEVQARALRAQAAELRPDQDDFTRFDLYLKLGEAEQRLGREQEAIDYLTKAYELLPAVERDLEDAGRRLSDPELYRDPERVKDMRRRYDAAEQRLVELNAALESLEEPTG